MKYAVLILVAAMLAMVMHVENVRDGARDARAQQLAAEVSIWKANYAQAVVRSTAAAETVRVVATRVAHKRDTLLSRITDTVAVKAFIYQTDTLRVQCLRCAGRLDSLRVASDGTIAAITGERDYYKQRQAKLRDRFGLFVGYGFAGNQSAPALQIGVGVRAFP